MRYAFSIVVLVTAAATSRAQPPASPYPTVLHESLLYVHPLVNYAPALDRLDAWEQVRLGKGGLVGAFGSVSTDDLLVDAHLAVNPELGRGLRFRGAMDWQELRHFPRDRRTVDLGLELTVHRGLGAVVATRPAGDKEDLDLGLGGLWASDDRTRYVQVLYVLENVVYDEKNSLGGLTRTSPRGLDWRLRLRFGRWTVASEGRWVRPFDRVYPDADRSRGLAEHRFADNDLAVRLRRRFGARILAEASFQLLEHADARAYHDDSTYDHDTADWLQILAVRTLTGVADRWRVRADLHHVRRRSDGTGWQTVHHRRTETIGAVFGQYFPGRDHFELGYVATFYDSRLETGYADKLMLSYVLGLDRGSELQFSLSHEISDGDFGGGSIQALFVF